MTLGSSGTRLEVTMVTNSTPVRVPSLVWSKTPYRVYPSFLPYITIEEDLTSRRVLVPETRRDSWSQS